MGACVERWVKGCAVGPGAPDDAQPSACQDADRVRVVAAPSAGDDVDAAGPIVGMPRVVGQTSDRLAQAVIASPAEGYAVSLAGLVGHGYRAGLSSERVEGGKALAHVAQLGQDLCGADVTGAREKHDDLT